LVEDFGAGAGFAGGLLALPFPDGLPVVAGAFLSPLDFDMVYFFNVG
jgi:hypothetical protein